jgi:hypothetical protein
MRKVESAAREYDESSDYRRRYRLGPISLGASSCRDRGRRLRGTRATVRKSGPTPAPRAWASARSPVTGGHHRASAHRKPPHHSESSPGVEAGVTGTPHCSSRPPSMSTDSLPNQCSWRWRSDPRTLRPDLSRVYKTSGQIIPGERDRSRRAPSVFDRNHPAGWMFGFRRKKSSGSYFFFSAANRP